MTASGVEQPDAVMLILTYSLSIRARLH